MHPRSAWLGTSKLAHGSGPVKAELELSTSCVDDLLPWFLTRTLLFFNCVAPILDLKPIFVGNMAFDPAWETGETHPSITVNNSGLNMGNNLNAGSIKMAKSFGIAGLRSRRFYAHCTSASKQPTFADVVNDLARGIGIPLRIDNSTLAGNYGHYARVLVDVDLAGFVLEKLLFETMLDYIEVDLYFESLLDFCTSRHVGHPVVKCKSVESSTYSVPTTNAFEVLNIIVTPTHTEDIAQEDTVPSSMAGINQEMNIIAPPTYPDLSAAPSQTNFDMWELNDDTVEDEWPPLQVEGSSKPSNEFDGIPTLGQQPNTMIMV
ncbi:hypothetical protein FNV43_RR21218 [Rhamnella rubrinervis]|uniref:Uncharacterized protein n=1 Tax=Rhamnella rubrinervis TaxID=2594499 RepID=A0A8K0DXG6_9ROSA|nr:hypothetical protein FNV43_RR21218 [Rhamnella rubrinervis]